MTQFFVPPKHVRAPETLIPGRKPTGPVEIDWTHPLARGLRYCQIFGRDNADLVTGKNPAMTGTVSRVGSSGYVANGDYLTVDTDFDSYTNAAGYIEMTCMASATADSTATSTYPALVGRGDTSTGEWMIRLSTPTFIQFYSNLHTGVTSAFSQDVPFCVAVTYGSGTGSNDPAMYLGQGGPIELKNSGTSGAPTATTNDFQIGCADSNSTRYWKGPIEYVYGWNRLLSVIEMRQIQSDPYQFLKPQGT